MRPEIPSALTATWGAVGFDPKTLEALPAGMTIRRASQPPLVDSAFTTLAGELELGAVLGEGGMGVVHAATQSSLCREVAVKRLRASGAGAGDIDRLVREARVTGGLEHPNIVPIHLLGRDDAGQPLIAMKRIEGRAWSELLAEADDRTSEAYLRRHLGVLLQVARALEFAHRRRVLHRDVKPENVMIGAFGEVYLVDWGIAVGLPPVSRGLIPASSVDRIEGTPLYLAPEMAAANGAELDERSDVYLLGATLHEILTGVPPHAAITVQAAVVKAFIGEPPVYPSSVPSELAEIARRASSRDRAARHPSAGAFADAIDAFLLHRGSSQLRDAAAKRVIELEAASREAKPRADGAREPLEPQLYALFHEARFAFEQALSSWPENAEARRGLRALLVTMIELELSSGTPGAALALLPALTDPPVELAQRVGAAAAEERARMAALTAMAHDADMGVGARKRQALTYFGAFAWGASLISAGITTRTGVLVIDHAGFAAMNVGFFVGTVISMGATRKITLANTASRRVVYNTLLIFGSAIVFWPLLGALGLSMPDTTLVGALVAAMVWASATFTLGVAWLPMVLGQFVVMLGAWLLPAYHLEIFGIMGALQTALMGKLTVRDGPSAGTSE